MRCLPGLVFALVSLAPALASADLIADEEAQCRSKDEGDPCSVGDESGSCAKAKCTRNDYSEGAPPKTKQVDCMVCKPGAPPEKGEDAAAQEREDGGPDEKSPEASADADATKEQAETVAKDPKKEGGCSVGERSPLSLGLGLLVAGFAGARRRIRR